MKRLLSVLVTLFLSLAFSQPTSEGVTARERAGYLGPVKRVVIEEEREDVLRRIRQELHYDELGNAIEFISYSYNFMDGKLRSRTLSQFNDQGQVLIQETLDPADNVLSQVLYRYNEQNKVSEQITYDSNGAITARQVFTYDSMGNPTREETYRGANLYRYNEFTYDETGNLLKRDRFDGEGTLLESRSYAENGLFMETSEYDETGAIEGMSTALLDERGNFVELIGYDSEGEVKDKSTFTYDERGLMLEQTFNSTVMGMSIETVTRYEYSFDDQGNWILRQEAEDVGFGMFDASDITETLYRTIEYY